jgi:GMP synthase-like glutamine amidotransferase
MKPVVIFRHSPTEGPGYFSAWLEAQRIPWRLVRIDAGEPVPESPVNAAGLVFMGGPMSVNDDLPWIPEALALIRRAVAADVPVLGHCLGGQLMSKALGGRVGPNPVKEIGWSKVRVADSPAARRWFGDEREFLSFHWHGESFTIPHGASVLASSDHCANQTFSLGPHLGMQCHVEMTPALIRTWCESGSDEIAASRASPAVQTPEEMERDIEARVAQLNAVADLLYARWAEGLVR